MKTIMFLKTDSCYKTTSLSTRTIEITMAMMMMLITMMKTICIL